ncbi:MAG: hypothetical protein DRN06_08450 [Thermoprotei archaeon]|nr:MAG: hypothetical protein DRN06_08450 [Thermoprotei archaeon]
MGRGTLTDEGNTELSRKVTDPIVKETGQPQHYAWVIIGEISLQNWMVDRLILYEVGLPQGDYKFPSPGDA